MQVLPTQAAAEGATIVADDGQLYGVPIMRSS